VWAAIERPGEREAVREAGNAMKCIAPGAYDDGAGGLHIVVSEMLDDIGLPDTRENRELLLQTLVARLRSQWTHTKIVLKDPDGVEHVVREGQR